MKSAHPSIRPNSFISRILLVTFLLWLSAASLAQDNTLLLVAKPQLENSVFKQSVILVATYDNGAALGIILNHHLSIDPGHLYPGDELLRDAGEIHFGGPVNPAVLLFLFRDPRAPEEAIHLFDDVYVSSSRKLLEQQLLRPREDSMLQFYAGYAGWAPGQLQSEIMHGSWGTEKATPKLLFDISRESIWFELNNKHRDDWI
jgi:putative transcriptional regulator